jgi:hypothetical protein
MNSTWEEVSRTGGSEARLGEYQSAIAARFRQYLGNRNLVVMKSAQDGA